MQICLQQKFDSHQGNEQNTNLVQCQFDHLKNLGLADFNAKGLPMNIDLSIGSQDYWHFLGQKQVWLKSGPIILSSRLGFVLSEPYLNDQNNSNCAVKFASWQGESDLRENVKAKNA